MKITIINYTYALRKTTQGKYYITRAFSKRGFKKWQQGLLKNRAGIINLF